MKHVSADCMFKGIVHAVAALAAAACACAGTPRQVKSGIFTADNSPSRAISAEPAPGGWTLATGGDTPDRADLLNTPVAALPAVCMAQPGRLAPYFGDLPAGTDPATISRRVTDQFLTTRPENYKPAGYHGNNGYGWNRIVQYSVVSLWVNAIECARLTGDEYREKRLVRLFDDFLPGGSKEKVCSRPRHVDDAIFGALPCEIYMLNKDKRCLDMGLMYADTQWCEPCEESFKERESAPPEVQREYYAKGLSVQTRLWIDDMYMITALQSQAYRATGERKYIERAAAEMILYLDRLQLRDGPAKGLFYHAPDVPFVWARGDGWMAAGMALLLEHLPKDSPHRPRIMDGYRLMMETLLRFQRADGLWCQLIDRPDDPRNWGESSSTAMFAYAYMVGVKRGWLDGAKYGPAARRAYLALCARMDKWGNVAGTCEGTGKRNNLEYYFKRRQVNGDPHAQAPMLWMASTLLADGAGEVKGIKTPATSKLFETRVDPESGVVSYALVYGAPDDNRQSLYFITKSMTEDGRFLLFNYTVGNEQKPKRSPKILMVADLLNDTVKPVARAEKISRENIESRTPFVGDPFIECKENYIVFGSPKLGGFFRCDLAEPSKAVKLCGLPKGLDDGEYKADRYYTHLTLTKDRKRAFLDTSLVNAAVKRRWVQGMLDLATGDFDKWGETPFCCNHGQVNPADDTLAMCAWEACWEKDGQEYRKKTGWYPRMWLMRKGWREMIPAKDRNFASHEIWDDDGKGFSWCGRPGDYVYHHDLATGKQERWCGISGARHNYISPDKKYVVCDDAPERWWRGCKWRVGFWNRETGKHVWLYSTRPALMPQDNQSRLHPDPHPHFVMNAKYVVCTANNADGHMDLYVTPVAQMVKMTSAE